MPLFAKGLQFLIVADREGGLLGYNSHVPIGLFWKVVYNTPYHKSTKAIWDVILIVALGKKQYDISQIDEELNKLGLAPLSGPEEN